MYLNLGGVLSIYCIFLHETASNLKGPFRNFEAKVRLSCCSLLDSGGFFLLITNVNLFFGGFLIRSGSII